MVRVEDLDAELERCLVWAETEEPSACFTVPALRQRRMERCQRRGNSLWELLRSAACHGMGMLSDTSTLAGVSKRRLWDKQRRLTSEHRDVGGGGSDKGFLGGAHAEVESSSDEPGPGSDGDSNDKMLDSRDVSELALEAFWIQAEAMLVANDCQDGAGSRAGGDSDVSRLVLNDSAADAQALRTRDVDISFDGEALMPELSPWTPELVLQLLDKCPVERGATREDVRQRERRSKVEWEDPVESSGVEVTPPPVSWDAAVAPYQGVRRTDAVAPSWALATMEGIEQRSLWMAFLSVTLGMVVAVRLRKTARMRRVEETAVGTAIGSFQRRFRAYREKRNRRRLAMAEELAVRSKAAAGRRNLQAWRQLTKQQRLRRTTIDAVASARWAGATGRRILRAWRRVAKKRVRRREAAVKVQSFYRRARQIHVYKAVVAAEVARLAAERAATKWVRVARGVLAKRALEQQSIWRHLARRVWVSWVLEEMVRHARLRESSTNRAGAAVTVAWERSGDSTPAPSPFASGGGEGDGHGDVSVSRRGHEMPAGPPTAAKVKPKTAAKVKPPPPQTPPVMSKTVAVQRQAPVGAAASPKPSRKPAAVVQAPILDAASGSGGSSEAQLLTNSEALLEQRKSSLVSVKRWMEGFVVEVEGDGNCLGTSWMSGALIWGVLNPRNLNAVLERLAGASRAGVFQKLSGLEKSYSNHFLWYVEDLALSWVGHAESDTDHGVELAMGVIDKLLGARGSAGGLEAEEKEPDWLKLHRGMVFTSRAMDVWYAPRSISEEDRAGLRKVNSAVEMDVFERGDGDGGCCDVEGGDFLRPGRSLGLQMGLRVEYVARKAAKCAGEKQASRVVQDFMGAYGRLCNRDGSQPVVDSLTILKGHLPHYDVLVYADTPLGKALGERYGPALAADDEGAPRELGKQLRSREGETTKQELLVLLGPEEYERSKKDAECWDAFAASGAAATGSSRQPANKGSRDGRGGGKSRKKTRQGRRHR